MDKNILQKRSKEMLDNPTPAEAVLADKLRSIKVHYVSQKVIGFYIVDFFIPSRSLVIEVDGRYHLKTKEYDSKRDKYLTKAGHKIVRLTNQEAFAIKWSELSSLIGRKKKRRIGKKRLKKTKQYLHHKNLGEILSKAPQRTYSGFIHAISKDD